MATRHLSDDGDSPAATKGARAPFAVWVDHFAANREVQVAMEAEIDWHAPCRLPERVRRAFVHSFQRFELGEGGDGAHLLAAADRAGDPVYAEALRRLVVEEQRHSALFARGLDHLGAAALDEHWSDDAFTRLRRSLGLRTELALFLVTESVAMGYFVALAHHAPDPVLRGIGRRIASDEVHHLRFQIDRLRVGFAGSSAATRAVVGLGWRVVGLGAATVFAVDHAAALRACGMSPVRTWLGALRRVGLTTTMVMGAGPATILGPAPTRSR